MCDWKPGDEVICIRDVPWIGPAPRWMFWTRHRPISGPKKDAVYTVVRVAMGLSQIDASAPPVVAVELAGLPKAWPVVHFRKVQRRDIGAWLKTAVGNTEKHDRSAREKVKA